MWGGARNAPTRVKKNVATGERGNEESFVVGLRISWGERWRLWDDPTIQSQQRSRTCGSHDTTLACGRWRQEDQELKGHSQLQSKFKASLHYLKPVLERKKKDRVGGTGEERQLKGIQRPYYENTGVRASTKLHTCLELRTNVLCLCFHKDTSSWLCAGDKGPLQRHSRGAKYPSLLVTTLLAPMGSVLVHPPKLFRK